MALPLLLSVPRTTGPGPTVLSAFGRAAVVAHVDRWLETSRPDRDGHAVLIVLDVDLDRALPVGYAEEVTRRHRLARYIDRALRAQLGDRDVIVRVDRGRFAAFRTGLTGECAAREATAVAGRVETALSGRIEGHGVRVTCGGMTVVDGGTRGGRQILAAVTGAMLAGKLLSDDRVVVVVAPTAEMRGRREVPGLNRGDEPAQRARR